MQSCVCAASESALVDRTVLEVELKGVCESYDVVMEPAVLLIPGLIPQDTVVRRKFKVSHHYSVTRLSRRVVVIANRTAAILVPQNTWHGVAR